MNYWRLHGLTSLFALSLGASVHAEDWSTEYCLLAPIKDTSVAFSGREIVKDVAVELGQRIQEGDVLMQLDTAGLPARLDRSLAELQQAERAMNRADQLAGVMIAEEREQRGTELAVRQAAVREIELEIERLTIRAPHEGIVVEILAEEGELLEENTAVRIVRLESLLVEIDMPSDRFGQYKPGQELVLTTERGTLAIATINFIDPIIDLASQSFRINAVLDNQGGAFIAGTSCSLEG